ncbi:hypothetical protein [Piscinibacter sp. XHJ-5]|uniref:hypothetical protein n=1 Tax=Piscinibacter sp. XHJ-5 TaxID=3037797 RepID=UPI0024536F40|nr:hypothetical protein [Piscinibacter sp. XHJ-5]
MVRCRWVAWAAAVAMSATAGWLARGSASEPPKAAVRQPPAPSTASVLSQPLIAVASDGSVTLRVEQQSLEWVLEEISRQSGWADVKARARPAAVGGTAPAAADEAVACTPPPSPIEVGRTLQAIERGSEAERFEGLMKARSAGLLVDERTLQSLFETDASERVRVAAFESYLEWRGDRPAALREALESALYVPSAAIQQEARQRLQEVQEMERADAHAPQGVP